MFPASVSLFRPGCLLHGDSASYGKAHSFAKMLARLSTIFSLHYMYVHYSNHRQFLLFELAPPPKTVHGYYLLSLATLSEKPVDEAYQLSYPSERNPVAIRLHDFEANSITGGPSTFGLFAALPAGMNEKHQTARLECMYKSL